MLFFNIILFSIATLSSALAAPIMKPGSFLVKKKSGSDITTLSNIHTLAHATSVKRFAYPAGLELIQTGADISPEEVLEIYRNNPNIEYIEPNYIYHTAAVPNDLYFKYQWGLSGSLDGDLNAPQAWDIPLTNQSNVVLGIIDTGVDYTHPDLVKNLWRNPGEIANNGVDDDQNGYVDDVHGINAITSSGVPWDDNSHGTHVAGIIGAEGSNGLGVSGVNQKTKMIACKFLSAGGSGDTAGALECMNYFTHLATRAQNPVKVVAINNSWGGGGYSQAFADAVKEHQKLGILFMVAASNETNNNDINPVFPANINLSNVVAVAATDSSDKLAIFSNYGRRTVHVAAPGVDILSTIPGRRYNYLDGTSMATPFVTGLAGFLKAKDPSLDWISIKNLIIAGGEPVVAAKNTTISGRRIRMIDTDGQGSLSCNNQSVVSRLLPVASTHSMRTGQSLKISVLKINCAKSTQAVLSSIPDSIKNALINDVGINGDDIAYDGVFNGSFIPRTAGSYNLTFPDNSVVSVTVTN